MSDSVYPEVTPEELFDMLVDDEGEIRQIPPGIMRLEGPIKIQNSGETYYVDHVINRIDEDGTFHMVEEGERIDAPDDLDD